MASLSYKDVADLYGQERPRYKDVAAQLGQRIRRSLAQQGIEVMVQWRAKTVSSFAKKAVRKECSDPLAEIGDKAGIRVIVHFEADISAVEATVGSFATVTKRESKRDALAYDALGYLGVHLDVEADSAGIDDDRRDELVGLPVEVQIHTKAQSAWAVVSHELLYKSSAELSEDLRRGITRLVALVELFDGEIARLRTAIEADPDLQDLLALAPLDNKIVEFTSRRPDRALSAIVVPPLVRLYDVPAVSVYEEHIAPFIEANESQIRDIYAEYAADTRANPLLYQPEALLAFERLTMDPDRLREAWPLARGLLDDLESVWGEEI